MLASLLNQLKCNLKENSKSVKNECRLALLSVCAFNVYRPGEIVKQ
jgi:hypothetical protein